MNDGTVRRTNHASRAQHFQTNTPEKVVTIADPRECYIEPTTINDDAQIHLEEENKWITMTYQSGNHPSEEITSNDISLHSSTNETRNLTALTSRRRKSPRAEGHSPNHFSFSRKNKTTSSPTKRKYSRNTNLQLQLYLHFLKIMMMLSALFWLLSQIPNLLSAKSNNSTLAKVGVRSQSKPIMANMPFEQVMSTPFSQTNPNAPSCKKPLNKDDIQFTLATQLSYNRLWMLNHHCQRWGSQNPISLAIYTNFTYDRIHHEIDTHLEHCDIRYMTIELVSSQNIPVKNYPINTLRNLALSNVKTSHVLYTDIDFFLAPQVHYILHLPSTREEFAKDAKLAAVIPALGYKRACEDETECLEENLKNLPDTPEEVYAELKHVNVFPFDPFNRGGHGSTRLWEWCRQEDGEFRDIPCFQSNRYEPYVAVRYCEDYPLFQEHFTGYGKNKLTQVMQMRHTGYRFSQLGGAFLVHYPHANSHSREIWDEVPKELDFDRSPANMRNARKRGKLDHVNFNAYKRGQIDALFVAFRKWLRDEVKASPRVHMCENSADDDAKLWVLNPKI